MPAFRADDIRALKALARLDVLVAEYTELVPAGGGQLKGRCPLHPDQGENLWVAPAKGFFTCFGCQASGDVFGFVMAAAEVETTFADAVLEVAARVGYALRALE